MSTSTEVADGMAETEEEARIREEQERDGVEPEQTGDEQERKTLAQLAAEEADQPDEPEQYTLFGTAPKVNAKVKATKVNSSHVKFKARQVDLPGQFDMGDVVELRVLARIDKLEFVQTHDGDGNVKTTKRLHTATALTVEQVGEVPEEFQGVDARSDEAR